MCPDGFVYNLEVTGTHTYSVNGIVVHNCHHSVSPTWSRVLTRWPKAKVIGVTATPQRLDGRGLGAIFTHMVKGPETSWLIDQGFLSRPEYYIPPQKVDLSGVHTVAGDYNAGELEEAMNTPKITGDAVQHYAKYAAGELAVVFCVSVKHAQDVALAFTASGFPAASIDGTMDKMQRRAVLASLASRQTRVLTSCALVSEGFDLPAVSVASLLRPTQSLSLHLQQLGRPLRPAPGKTRTLILDHVGNVLRHGFAEDKREWTLDDKPKSAKKGEAGVSVCQCPECFRAHHPAKECPYCGHVYEGTAIEIVDGELEAVRPQTCSTCSKMYPHSLPSCPHCRVDKRRQEGAARTYEELAALGRARGYREGWAKFRWEARMRKVAA